MRAVATPRPVTQHQSAAPPAAPSAAAPSVAAEVAAGGVAVIGLTHLAVDVLAGGFSALLPSTADRLSLSTTAVGVLVALFSLTALASQPLMGGLADRFDARRVTAIAAVLAAAVLATVAVAGSVVVLLGVIVLGGLASAAFHPAGAMEARRAAAAPETAVAAFSAGGTAGLAIGPVAVLALAEGAGRPFVLSLVVPALVLAVLVWRRPSPPVRPVAERRARPPLRTLLHGRVPVLAAAATLVAVTSTTVASTVPLWIADGPDADSTDPAIGWALATFSLAAAAGGLLGGIVARRADASRLLPASLLAAIVPTVGLVAVQPGSAWALVALAAAGLLLGPVIPVLLVVAQDAAPDRAASASGMIMGLSHGLAGVAFLGVAVVIDVAGHGAGVVVGAAALVPAAWLVHRQLMVAGSQPIRHRVAVAVCGCLVSGPIPVRR